MAKLKTLAGHKLRQAKQKQLKEALRRKAAHLVTTYYSSINQSTLPTYQSTIMLLTLSFQIHSQLLILTVWHGKGS